MLRKNFAAILMVSAALGLTLGVGCKKKESDSDSKGGKAIPKGGKKAPMEIMEPARERARPMRARAATPRARIKARAGALPVPADYTFVHLNLKAARGTALYKQFEPRIKKMIADLQAEQPMMKTLFETCKVNPLTTVNDVMLGMSMGGAKKAAVIMVVKGDFDTAKAMACVKPAMKKAKIEPSDVTVQGKKGLKFTAKGKETTLLAFSEDTFVAATGDVQSKMTDVLEGKAPSVTDAPLYKEFAPKATKDTVLSVIVPSIPASATSSMPLPVLKDIKSVAMMIGMPDGGLDIKVALNIGDPQKAAKLAKSLPMLVNLAKSKLPQVGNTIAQNLKVKSDKGWVRVALALNKDDFKKLLTSVKGMLGGALKGGRGSAPAPGKGAASKDAAKKKGAKKKGQ